MKLAKIILCVAVVITLITLAISPIFIFNVMDNHSNETLNQYSITNNYGGKIR